MKQSEAGKLLTACFDSWYPTLVRYAHGLTGQLSLAEDLTQDVFLRFYRQLRSGEKIDNPKAWMFCVLRNDISKFRRAEMREDPLPDTELAGTLVAWPEVTLDVEGAELDDLERLFGVLTTREQEVMLLRLASLKYRQIAERLEISPSAVNTLLARAIRKLRREAKKQGWKPNVEVVRQRRQTLQ